MTEGIKKDKRYFNGVNYVVNKVGGIVILRDVKNRNLSQRSNYLHKEMNINNIEGHQTPNRDSDFRLYITTTGNKCQETDVTPPFLFVFR
jgi:hypothetical protein